MLKSKYICWLQKYVNELIWILAPFSRLCSNKWQPEVSVMSNVEKWKSKMIWNVNAAAESQKRIAYLLR